MICIWLMWIYYLQCCYVNPLLDLIAEWLIVSERMLMFKIFVYKKEELWCVIFIYAVENFNLNLSNGMLFVDARPTVTTFQEPTGYVNIGDSVTLTCNADSDLPIIDRYWTHRNTPLQRSATYTINPVSSSHVGMWTCHVKVQRDIFTESHLILRALGK